MKRPLILLVAALPMLSLLAVFAYTGSFTRFLADDYCFSAALRQHGFWPAQAWFYQTTSNRFPVIFVIGASEALGDGMVSLWPALLIVLWLAGLALAGRSLLRNLPEDWRWPAGIWTAALLVGFTLLLAPNRLQSLYWRSGALTYTLPLALGGFLLAGLLPAGGTLQNTEHAARDAIQRAGLLLLAFIAGGCSETYNTLQTAGLGIGLLAAAFLLKGDQRRRVLLGLGFALAGSLAAMLLLAVSPGNARRWAELPLRPDVITLLGLSLKHALDFIVDSLRIQPLPNAVLLAMAATGGYLLPPLAQPRRLLRALLISVPVLYLLLVAVVMPSALAQQAYPEPRALIVARFTLVAWLATAGVLAGQLARAWPPLQRPAMAVLATVALLAFSAYPLRAAWQAVGEAQLEASWAQAWDSRDAAIRASLAGGETSVRVQEFDSRGSLPEYGPDRDNWVNRCAADYYGLESIEANP